MSRIVKNSLLYLLICSGIMACSQRKEETELWSLRTADSFIEKFPDPDSIHWKGNPNHFDWQAGYTMFTMEKLWRTSGDIKYFNYIKRYIDQQVGDKGEIPDFTGDALDHFLPGYAIIFMYEQTGEEKYKIAAGKIREAFNSYPRNSDGGFWHNARMKNQMWIDGVYMGQMFLARYGAVIGDSNYAFKECTEQMKIIQNRCGKPNGLLLHAWDESKSAPWADKQMGRSPEVWSEGLGWYAVLIADVLDYIPMKHPEYNTILADLQNLCEGLRECQDKETGMWCQVVDKPDSPGNWNETSGTGMFLYLIKKSIEKGYISKEVFMPVVDNAYKGIIKKAKINSEGLLDIYQCSSIGVKNSYEEYISQPREINTFAGVTSFILGTLIMEL